MKKSKIIFAAAAIIVVTLLTSAALFKQCSGSESSIPEEKSDEIAAGLGDDLIYSNTQFGFNIFNELILEDKDQNIFISPFSILLALAMAYNGAVGDTSIAMADALEFSGFDLEELNTGLRDLTTSIKNADSDIELAIANSIWMDLGFEAKEDFIERNKKYFSSEVREIDFSDAGTVDVINGWIADATRDKIEKMLDKIPYDAVMYLINAIYFKGNWTDEFDESLTSDDDFYLAGGSTRKVPMMNKREKLLYCSGDGFSGVELPYGQEKMAMYIILPDEGKSVDSVIGSLDADRWKETVQSFSEKQVILSMPKYKMEYGVKLLNDVLTNMGMGIAFSLDADFSGIRQDIFISRVLHKAVIEVNEKGSEAAAATVVEMLETAAMPEEPVEFTVNRPFFFVIADDRSGSILFMGKVVEP
jgi:serine protease inhibitor